MLKTPPSSCPPLDVEIFERLLVSGGDERIAIDPLTGRNRYGTPRGRAPGEAWFSSSTATAISPRGYDAALAAYRSNVEGGDARTISAWFESLRARLMLLFGTPGSQVVLSASGTELEFIALGLARSILPGPLTNVVIAPGETGRGVPLAAVGRHFLGSAPFCGSVACGALLEGFETPETLTAKIEIRDETGVLRSPESIDRDLIRAVEDNVARGRSVLVHVLDCSKTNLGGVRRSTASALMARHAGKVLVVVDACQLRCEPDQLRADLGAGFMVMISGSKFGAGPPFAAALLLPPGLLEQLRQPALPAGLLAYTAAEDWPVAWRGRLMRRFDVNHNIGVGLRWEAALAEVERLFALPIPLRDAVAHAFADAVAAHIREDPRLALFDQGGFEGPHCGKTIWPIVTAGQESISLTSEHVHHALRLARPDDPMSATSKRVFHVGQPVSIGRRSALRVCLSASQIVDVAESMAQQRGFDAAVAPLIADIDGLFRKWRRIADALGRRG